MKNLSAENMWGNFLNTRLEYAFKHTSKKVVRFYDNKKDANACAKLIRKGGKKAISHSLKSLQLRKETLPKIGDFSVVTDWEGKAKCIIKTTEVKLIPFFNITDEIAQIEGEGDKSLNYWKKAHWNRYTCELAEFDCLPSESMIVVCEIFEKVHYKLDFGCWLFNPLDVSDLAVSLSAIRTNILWYFIKKNKS